MNKEKEEKKVARKENKEYTVDINTKDVYLNDGYDIYDEKGKLIEYSPKKQVPISDYIKLEEQVKELTLKLEEANNNVTDDKELVKNNKALEKKVKELTAKL